MTQHTEHRVAFDDAVVQGWWRALTPDPRVGRRGDRAALAELRRCHSPREVQLLPPFSQLLRAMPDLPDSRLDDLAVVVGAVAHVRVDEPRQRVAQQLAHVAPGAGQPTMSPTRFRRALQMRGPEERFGMGARIVRQLGGTVNVRDLARSLYWWDHDDAHARRWALDYYAAIPEKMLKKEANS